MYLLLFDLCIIICEILVCLSVFFKFIFGIINFIEINEVSCNLIFIFVDVCHICHSLLRSLYGPGLIRINLNYSIMLLVNYFSLVFDSLNCLYVCGCDKRSGTCTIWWPWKQLVWFTSRHIS